MSQRVSLGLSSRAPVAVVREHGSRVECIALASWVVPRLLEDVGSLWVDYDHWSHQSPERTVLYSLRET